MSWDHRRRGLPAWTAGVRQAPGRLVLTAGAVRSCRPLVAWLAGVGWAAGILLFSVEALYTALFGSEGGGSTGNGRGAGQGRQVGWDGCSGSRWPGSCHLLVLLTASRSAWVPSHSSLSSGCSANPQCAAVALSAAQRRSCRRCRQSLHPKHPPLQITPPTSPRTS